MSTSDFKEIVDRAKALPDYWKELANLGFVYGIDRLLRKANPPLKRSDLAKLTGKPESTISRNLNGRQNLTISTMVEMAEALDAAVHIHVEKKGVRGAWVPMEEMKSPTSEVDPDVVGAAQTRGTQVFRRPETLWASS